jgi:ArsR family transcriptional regulator
MQHSKEQMGEVFKALGDPVRLGILRLLPDTDDCCCAVYNVSELAEELGVSQPTVSHHLKILKHAGIVHCSRMCRDVYYWIDRPVLEATLEHFGTAVVDPRQYKEKKKQNDNEVAS